MNKTYQPIAIFLPDTAKSACPGRPWHGHHERSPRQKLYEGRRGGRGVARNSWGTGWIGGVGGAFTMTIKCISVSWFMMFIVDINWSLFIVMIVAVAIFLPGTSWKISVPSFFPSRWFGYEVINQLFIAMTSSCVAAGCGQKWTSDQRCIPQNALESAGCTHG